MTIQKRPTPIRPSVFSVVELDAWLVKQQDAITAQPRYMSNDAMEYRAARWGAFDEVRECIEGWLAEEREGFPEWMSDPQHAAMAHQVANGWDGYFSPDDPADGGHSER